jgi:tRNA(Ile)-lysidine synthase
VSELLQQVERQIQNHRLLKRGQKILVAVSGGLDSMVLLHCLQALSAKRRWKLAVAHFNHQLRGRSSDADETLVRQTASALKLPFVAGSANVQAFAAKSKLSVEMAARKLRHEFFARVARERHIQVVALAHHADDQVELFFLRLLRGAGGEGVAGMKWRSPSPVDPKIALVRPLLDADKAELREFARENKIRFREDATNAQLEMPRNRVRNELLPLLRRHYQPALTRTVLRLMEIVGAESDFAGEAARQWLVSNRITERAPRPGPLPAKRGEGGLRPGEGPVFNDLPVAIQRRVLQLQLAGLGVPADFELIESLRQLPAVFVSVGPEFSVSRDAEGKVNLRERQVSKFNERALAVKLGRAGEVIFDGVKLSWRFDPAGRFARLQRKSGREFFDADKIGNEVVLRHWLPGDRFQPIGMESALKLQDWFVNQRIPSLRRCQLVVAAAETGGIFWVEGLRIGESFKLTPQTKRGLIWHWQRAQTRKNQ